MKFSKNKAQLLYLTVFFLFFSMSAWSQVDKGLELFMLEDFEKAKNVFEQSVSLDPDISYYYLGEIALRNNNAEEAAEYFGKGISTDKESIFCQLGKMKLDFKSSPEDFKKNIRALANKNKKKSPFLMAVASAYLDNNMPEEAKEALSMALRADKENPYLYIFEGDWLMKKGELGKAATQYEQAINFDPKCVVAYIKSSVVYESISSATALETLKNGLAENQDNILICKYLARNYYKNGYYEKAIAEYENLNRNETLQSEDSRNYAASLYFAGKYNDALTALNRIATTDSNHPVINRLLMYTQDKLKNYDAVITAGEKFFGLSGSKGNVNYLSNDYIVFADALINKGEIDEATETYTKAVTLETEKKSLSKEIAKKFADADRTDVAANFYQKYIDAIASGDVSDYLQLGIYYYRTASQLSGQIANIEKNQTDDEADLSALKENMTQNISKANEAFSKVIELAPESYQGYYWRANANTLSDPDLSKGLANADYLKTIDILSENGETEAQSRLIEAYRYFSIYHLYQFDSNKKESDKNKSKEYAEQVLKLKSDDETSLKIIEVLKN